MIAREPMSLGIGPVAKGALDVALDVDVGFDPGFERCFELGVMTCEIFSSQAFSFGRQ